MQVLAACCGTAYSLAVECEESWSDRRALSDEAERLLHDAEALLQKHWQSRIGDLTDQLAALGEISFDVSGQPHVMSALPAFEPFGKQVINRDNASPRGYPAKLSRLLSLTARQLPWTGRYLTADLHPEETDASEI